MLPFVNAWSYHDDKISDISGTDFEILSSTEETLTCSVTDITAAVTFAWTDSDGGAVTSSDGAYSESEDSQESTITVTPDEDTTYTCVITDDNADESPSVSVTLNVFGKQIRVKLTL